MKMLTHPGRWFVLFSLVLSTLACGLPFSLGSSSPNSKTPGSAANSTTNGGAQSTENRLLVDPAVGLASLKNYQVSFHQDVTGKLDGKPYERHTQLKLIRSGEQIDFTREHQGSNEKDSYSRLVVLGKALYRWQTTSDLCQGETGYPQPDEILEPAKLLLPIQAANRVGNEILNQIKVVHYRFDQNSLPLAEPKADLTGDVWLAESDGYVVKYTLVTAAPTKFSGKGLEIGQNWSYELSPVSESGAVALPENCIEVPVELPTLPDAQAKTYSSGWMDFMTQSTGVQAANFYFQKLPELGWATHQKELAAEPKLPFSAIFTKANRLLSLIIDKSDPSGLDVSIFVYNPQMQSADANAGPQDVSTPEPQPTIDPTKSGLPGDVPLYPGATGLISSGKTVMYNAPDKAEVILTFFNQKMVANGWLKKSENDNSNTTIQIWQKDGRTLSIVIGVNNGITYVAVTTLEEP